MAQQSAAGVEGYREIFPNRSNQVVVEALKRYGLWRVERPDVLGGGAGNRVVFSYRVVRGVRIRDLLGSASARRRVNFMFRSRFAGG